MLWSIVFTKPGFESVVEPLQSDRVNYSTDGASFCALKLARSLEGAREGRLQKPTAWVEHDYPGESPVASSRRTESSAVGKAETSGQDKGKGWRIPSDDQRYLQCVYRVEFRLPKQEVEGTRVERVTVERVTVERNTTTAS